MQSTLRKSNLQSYSHSHLTLLKHEFRDYYMAMSPHDSANGLRIFQMPMDHPKELVEIN